MSRCLTPSKLVCTKEPKLKSRADPSAAVGSVAGLQQSVLFLSSLSCKQGRSLDCWHDCHQINQLPNYWLAQRPVQDHLHKCQDTQSPLTSIEYWTFIGALGNGQIFWSYLMDLLAGAYSRSSVVHAVALQLPCPIVAHEWFVIRSYHIIPCPHRAVMQRTDRTLKETCNTACCKWGMSKDMKA